MFDPQQQVKVTQRKRKKRTISKLVWRKSYASNLHPFVHNSQEMPSSGSFCTQNCSNQLTNVTAYSGQNKIVAAGQKVSVELLILPSD